MDNNRKLETAIQFAKDAKRDLAKAEKAHRRASGARVQAARLATEAGLTRAQVGELLGVSPQRVQQLLDPR